MENELLPCPFCGNKAYTRIVRDGVSYKDKGGYTAITYNYKVRCECSVCHSYGKRIRVTGLKQKMRLKDSGFLDEHHEYGNTIKVAIADAIAAWNTRAGRICHVVKASRKYVLSDGTELFEDGCSECNGYLVDGDNYCPNCGAKVVDE